MNRLDWIPGTFAYPQRLWWLIAIGIGLAVAWRAIRRCSAWWSVIDQGRASAALDRSRWRMLDLGLGCAALVLTVLALAAPVDEDGTGLASQSNLQIVCLLDRSRSMLVRDVDGSRLELSRALIGSVAAHAPGAAIAVVSFAGRSRVDIPLTRDAQGLLSRLGRITAIEDDLYGSNLAAGLKQAQQCFATRMQSDKLLLVFSDGETHQPASEFLEKAESLSGLPPGTQVIVVCVGDQYRGGRIPLSGSSGQPAEFLKYDGETVYSLADPDRMQHLAESLAGDFLHAKSAAAFETVLQRTLSSFTGPGDRVLPLTGQSGYLLLVRVASVLLLIRLALPWVRTIQLRRPSTSVGVTGWLLLLLLVSGGAGPAAPQWSSRQYIQRYNQGVAEYRSGSYQAAREAFSDAAQATDASVRMPATFNLAGSIVGSAGQTAATSAVTDIRQAIGLYRHCLQAGYRTEDVRVNIEVAFGLLQGESGEPPGESSSPEGGEPDVPPGDSNTGQADAPPGSGGRSGSGSSGEQASNADASDDLERPLAGSAAEQMLRDIRDRGQAGDRPAQSSPTEPSPPVPASVGKPW